MKIALCVLICVFYLPLVARAQAADPDAVYLSAKMDTIDRQTNDFVTMIQNLNVGLKNGDPYEDFLIDYGGSPNYALLRYGGPDILKARLTPRFEEAPLLTGDFNGDGIKDVMSTDGLWHIGKKDYPYYDSLPDGRLRYWSARFSYGPFAVYDYDGDGYDDVIGSGGETASSDFLIWRGGPGFGTRTDPTDSMPFRFVPYRFKSWAIASFGKGRRPVIYLSMTDTINGKEIYWLGVVKHDTDLTHDSISWLSRSDSGGIAAQRLYAMDVTGDGTPDLVVTDFSRVYIFKGGDDFGSYPLTPEHAFYTITSPRTSDYSDYPLLEQFGKSIYSVGDITGSGIPYMLVEAQVNDPNEERVFGFLYACGKALDSLYDGEFEFETDYLGFTVDTLHSVDNTGRTAVLGVENYDYHYGYDLDFLMYRNCDRIPHKTNPQMLVGRSAASMTQKIAVRPYPSIADRFVKLEIEANWPEIDADVTIRDVLGRAVSERAVQLDPGSNTEYFDTGELPSGTYAAEVRTSDGEQTARFVIRR